MKNRIHELESRDQEESDKCWKYYFKQRSKCWGSNEIVLDDHKDISPDQYKIRQETVQRLVAFFDT